MKKLKATFNVNGMEVEGTPEEILKFKDELDKRNKVQQTFEMFDSGVFNSEDERIKIFAKVLSDKIFDFSKKYPNGL
jgi:hypothetical protein